MFEPIYELLKCSASSKNQNKLVILFAPVGTQINFVMTAASHLAAYASVLVIETDCLIDKVIEKRESIFDQIHEYIRYVLKKEKMLCKVVSIIGYCSSSSIALAASMRVDTASLFIVNGSFFFPLPKVEKTQYERDIHRMMVAYNKGSHTLIYETIKKMISSKVIKSEEEFQMNRPFSTVVEFEKYLRRLSFLQDIEFLNLLREIKVPVYICSGSQDVHVHQDAAHFLLTQLPQASMIVDPAGQHHDWIRGEGAFRNAISDIVEKVSFLEVEAAP